ncbi:MAG: PHP domain-containing protein, partial [Hymenobacteraceae bacterium]|nr:PHP domain-containing protein [Hymenobacteraceae bacterium]MDX5394646.1 PHP domain-containing protein [Hymenobacteraceae bacterium]MDX5510677.1 PHP domain-containing protein [Hymenobacteraceae bacterium]
MENKKIARLFRKMATLMELHDENAFKTRTYQNASQLLERVEQPLAQMEAKALEQLEGVGKTIAAKIVEINQTGTFQELEDMLAQTPPGVIGMLDIKGVGPKKIRAIWKEMGLETLQQLLEACENNQLSKYKGFGAKTQESIKEAVQYLLANQGKMLYAEAEPVAAFLHQILEKGLKNARVTVTGELRRCLEIVDTLQIVIGTENPLDVHKLLNKTVELEQDELQSGPFVWRGKHADTSLKVEVKLFKLNHFIREVFVHSASIAHLTVPFEDSKTLLQLVREQEFESEEAIYKAAGMDYIEPEMREGTNELELAKAHKLPQLLELQDLKGILHNHSTYSDGANTLEQMALACRDLGYQYLGISDHSKTAAYAGGLREGDVLRQQKEIDELNKKLAPFKVFKGIESDILGDGSLDYEEDILKTFDFVVASIHSNLNMTEEKATERLLRAIENPYTTILGHPTGRLLLRREGYPINHKLIIDACAKHNVVIEINANPWRLDLDWRWVQ